MFDKPAYTNEDILFFFPLSENREEAISYIEAHGIEDFLRKSNIKFYAPNILPLNQKKMESLSKKSAEEALDDISKYIERSYLMWSNPAAEATQNRFVNNRKFGYKLDRYGTDFMKGDMEALSDDAFCFPLFEDEMFIALEVINEKGIRFFVEHCADGGLPSCPYVKDTVDETISSFESLNKWYGPYWLLGQLNTASILDIKESKK